MVSSHQKAFEQMRAERNAFSRDLTALQAEVANAQRKVEHMVNSEALLVLFPCSEQDCGC